MSTTDATIREVLVRRLRAVPHVFVREEHGIPGRHYNDTLIADVIAVGEHLHGFEIKSDVDSLARLKRQAPVYSMVCDRVTVIVGAKHADRIASLVPEWWGIQVARGEPVVLDPVRPATDNPSIDPRAVAEMLWVSELREIAKRVGFRHRGIKRDLTERLIASVSLDELRAIVRQALRSRDYRRESLARGAA